MMKVFLSFLRARALLFLATFFVISNFLQLSIATNSFAKTFYLVLGIVSAIVLVILLSSDLYEK